MLTQLIPFLQWPIQRRIMSMGSNAIVPPRAHLGVLSSRSGSNEASEEWVGTSIFESAYHLWASFGGWASFGVLVPGKLWEEAG